jgi:hypothetical protein
MAFAGFTEEDRFDAAARAKRFFNEAHAFNTNRARLRGKATTERHAEGFEPAIVAAGQDTWRGAASSASGGFSGSGHQWERNKFRRLEANRGLHQAPRLESGHYACFAVERAGGSTCRGFDEARRS